VVVPLMAAVAIPAFLDSLDRSRQKRTVAEIKNMAAAINAFKEDYGGYPISYHDGDPSITFGGKDGSGWADAFGRAVFIPKYIQEIPRGDGWKIPYTYNSGCHSAEPDPSLGEVVGLHGTLCRIPHRLRWG